MDYRLKCKIWDHKAIAPHSSALAWKIPWTEEPGGLQSMGSLGVGHDWATSLSLFTFLHWRRKWQPTPVFLLENPRDGGAWWAAVYGVTQGQTRLKRLRSSSTLFDTSPSGIWRSGFLGGSFIFSIFWLHCVANGILVSRARIEPTFPAVEAQHLNHWITKEIP